MRRKIALLAVAAVGVQIGFTACSPSVDRPSPATIETPDSSIQGSDGGTRSDGGSTRTLSTSYETCADAGKALVLVGDKEHYIVNEAKTFTAADSKIELGAGFGNDIVKSIEVRATPSGGDESWSVDFQNQDDGLTATTYPDAGRAPFYDPGLSIHSPGRGCNTVTGNFQIHELTLSGDAGPDASVIAFGATFEHHCEGSRPALVGCVRWTP